MEFNFCVEFPCFYEPLREFQSFLCLKTPFNLMNELYIHVQYFCCSDMYYMDDL